MHGPRATCFATEELSLPALKTFERGAILFVIDPLLRVCFDEAVGASLSGVIQVNLEFGHPLRTADQAVTPCSPVCRVRFCLLI